MSFAQDAAPDRELLGSQGAAGVREWIGQIIIVTGRQQEFTHQVSLSPKKQKRLQWDPNCKETL
jgi:hypothetical protein